jgi:tetratricopeptide (TPR) repeat protein
MEQPIPAEIAGFNLQALEASERGERVTAIWLQQKVLDWVNTNLPRIHPYRAECLKSLGLYLRDNERFEEGFFITQELVITYRDLVKNHQHLRGELALSLNSLSQNYKEIGLLQNSFEPGHEAVQMLRELSRNDSKFDPDLSMVLQELGGRYFELSCFREALELSREGLVILRKVVQKDSKYLAHLAVSLNNFGNICSDYGDNNSMIIALEEAVKLARQTVFESTEDLSNLLPNALVSLSYGYRSVGRSQEALAAAEESVTLLRNLSGQNPLYLKILASALNNLGDIFFEQERHQDALASLQECVQIFRKESSLFPELLPFLVNNLLRLASIYANNGCLQQARSALEESAAILRKLAVSEPAYAQELEKVHGFMKQLGP